MSRTQPYGAWPSPLTAELLTEATRAIEEMAVDGHVLWWVELHPDGRSGLSSLREGRSEGVELSGHSIGSRVHEYGGMPLGVRDGVVCFVDRDDQRLWRLHPDGRTEALTPEGKLRFAQPVPDGRRGLVWAVCEDHTESDLAPTNSLVRIPLSGGPPQIAVEGYDFVAYPSLSPEGDRLAYLTWSHPNLPWDSTQLWVAPVDDDGQLGEPELVAGSGGESICHPQWSPDGRLHFLSDRTGWWLPYRWEGHQSVQLIEDEAEYGRPTPSFSRPSYGFLDERRAVFVRRLCGEDSLVILDLETGRLDPVPTECSVIWSVAVMGDDLVFVGGSATEAAALRSQSLRSSSHAVLRSTVDAALPAEVLAEPEAVTFPTMDGGAAHGWYYAPVNGSLTGPSGQKPPLVVMIHGGPVGSTTPLLQFGVLALAAPAFWTSRGFALLDVNYRGSMGYGRDYLQALYGRWGEVDVDDAIAGARFLARRGDVDPEKVVIRGGSAGGYTTMCALGFRDFFAAGTAYFGISDLDGFGEVTHKFESRYLEQLLGDRREHPERYRNRSVINSVQSFEAPILLIQGSEDRICVPEQSRGLSEALRAAGKPVEYLELEGEGHGFRRAESIRLCLETELGFYRQVLGIETST